MPVFKFALWGLCTLPFALSFGQSAPSSTAVSPAVKQAVDKACRWLIGQQRAQGCFLDENRGDPVPQHSGALTAMAIMGLTSVGHMPLIPPLKAALLPRACAS